MADEKEYPLFTPQGERAIIDDTRSWVDPRGYRLSDRLWQGAAYDRRSIDGLLRRGVQGGTPVLEVAKQLEEFLTPEGRSSRTRYPTGRGSGNAAARRLARTETSRAFNRASLEANEANPFVEGSKWNLSGTHSDADQCDDNAQGHSSGMAPGEYKTSEFPRIPNHPHCRCYVTPVTANTEDVLRQLVSPAPSPFVFDEVLPEADLFLPSVLEEFSPKKLSTYQRKIADLRLQMEKLSNYSEAASADKLTRQAGALVRKRASELMISDQRKAYTEYTTNSKTLEKLKKEQAALWKKMQVETDDVKYEAMKERYYLIRDKLRPELSEKLGGFFELTGSEYRRALLQAVSEVREVGSTLTHALGPRNQADIEALFHNEVRAIMPKEWWDDSVDWGEMNFTFDYADPEKRGHYLTASQGFGDATLDISGGKAPSPEIAVHEFVHRVEDVRPRVKLAERGFYDRRTKGEALERLDGGVTGGGYREDELTRRDEFPDAYMGKDYGGFAFEIATMGLQDMLRGGIALPRWVVDDNDLADFIAGLLVTA